MEGYRSFRKVAQPQFPESFGFLHNQVTPFYIPTSSGENIYAWHVPPIVLNVANIPPLKILSFGPSLGTTVDLAVSEHFALQPSPVVFAGYILVPPSVDAATLMATYKARFPLSFGYLKRLLQHQWSSTDRFVGYIQANEANREKYRTTIGYPRTTTMFRGRTARSFAGMLPPETESDGEEWYVG